MKTGKMLFLMFAPVLSMAATINVGDGTTYELAAALGLTAKRKKTSPSFLKYAGGLSLDEAAELRAFVDGAAFSRIDKSDWE